MRDWDFLNAGDPGAIDALFGQDLDRRDTTVLDAFRRHGWLKADLDPLGKQSSSSRFVLSPLLDNDNDEAARLSAIYCGTIGWEFGHVQDLEKFEWLAAQAEAADAPVPEDRLRALCLIRQGELFETTLGKRLPMVKTFGLSGSEGFLVAVDQVIRTSRAKSVCVGGMHRGRLTQLALLFGKPLDRLIEECRGLPDVPEEFGIASDVPYHLGWEGVRGDGISVWVAPHPSHLSLSGPVAAGIVRGRNDGSLPLILHTDAAFAGQGINAELLQISALPAYAIGGSVHIILNNQIGFTTEPGEARSSRTCADVAKIIEAPILHVNGNDPDAVCRAAAIAVRYRETFASDIVLDIIGFRRPGHNEVEEPRYTQPSTYRLLDALPPLSDIYAGRLGWAVPELPEFRRQLDTAFQDRAATSSSISEIPAGLAPDIEDQMCLPVTTGCDLARLAEIGCRLTSVPDDFQVHRKVAEFLEKRRRGFDGAFGLDWASGETLALASLADDGHAIRLSGQDSVRGAFSQRHFHIHDQNSDRVHRCLDGFGTDVEVFNTPLIENAVLGFEYGLSVASPQRLTIWEAQFGDFLNVCQAMFDQYVTGGEQRWLFSCGLVMLLPHGWDGGGPDHSTGHVERILARCAQGNIQLVNPSTPAQMFHVLRRQLKGSVRKPLVILSPKTLLRHADCRSDLGEFGPGTGFRLLIDDPVIDAARIKRVVLCSGKVFYALDTTRQERGLEKSVALIRMEQLYPLPRKQIADTLARYGAAELFWVQEEPENLGAFTWLDRKLERIIGRSVRLISRPTAASPAVGWRSWHAKEEALLMDRAFVGMK